RAGFVRDPGRSRRAPRAGADRRGGDPWHARLDHMPGKAASLRGMLTEDIETVLDFWFADGRERQWFERSDAFDRLVGETLLSLHERAAAGELDGWAAEPRGALALVILLDQVPRNLFRGTPRAFATDAKARDVARAALAAGHDAALGSDHERMFLYLPFEHSEELADQELSVQLFGRLSDPEALRYAQLHRDIVCR